MAESDRLLRRITSPHRPDAVRVRFTTCPEPCRSADELIASVTHGRLLAVSRWRAIPTAVTPSLTARGGAHDRFRAVHDIVGHAGLGLGFDRNGEFAAWLYQARLHSPLARRALATELHGQHSVYWTRGHMAEPKAVLLDPQLLRRSHQLAGEAARADGAPAAGLPRMRALFDGQRLQGDRSRLETPMHDHTLEPAAQDFADATSQPPFLYELGPDGARKVLDDLRARADLEARRRRDVDHRAGGGR